MGIVHVELFEFKPLATQEEVQEVCDRMMSLKDRCTHPKTHMPYLKTAVGGANVCPEGKQGRISHVFVSEFDTPEDRKFYLEEDPARREFVESIEGFVEGRQVVEFSPGEF
ncbi:dabb-domain-containing protein [Neurospora tetraspora]|uniref:Dabb-domain-containing protein n=1 Tax=Neurospora tetraspora TaxID=94610 RepID=A0AAE0JJG7_9PEZI|nr:dabb-domain-containing protein [Neurospora tetraspora]